MTLDFNTGIVVVIICLALYPIIGYTCFECGESEEAKRKREKKERKHQRLTENKMINAIKKESETAHDRDYRPPQNKFIASVDGYRYHQRRLEQRAAALWSDIEPPLHEGQMGLTYAEFQSIVQHGARSVPENQPIPVEGDNPELVEQTPPPPPKKEPPKSRFDDLIE